MNSRLLALLLLACSGVWTEATPALEVMRVPQDGLQPQIVADGAWAAWESDRQIFWASVDPAGKAGAILSAPGSGPNRKHPVLAVDARQPLADGERDALPTWSKVAVFARPDGGFGVMY